MRFSIKQRLRLKKRPSNVSDSSLLFSVSSSKAVFALISLLLLPYSFNTQALSATTANTIQGTAPYLTFDSGATKVTTTDGLLSITLSDTTTTPATNTIITPASNTSTAASPYNLPVASQTFADVGMLVPVAVNTIGITSVIGAPNNYWGDDDGDGQGTGGVSATGNLSVVITDNNNQPVNRNDALSICNAPYKVVLTSTAGTLSTQYGAPNSAAFTASNATYYINPNSPPKVCFAKPTMSEGTGNYAGPTYMWNTTKGFIPQSTTPATYDSNFPTTGANGLYFDLNIGGSATALTWAPVQVNGITATMTASTPTSVRVTLTGPTTAIPLAPFATTGSTFELEGKSGSTTVAKYGFKITRWYVSQGTTLTHAPTVVSWCTSLGYRMPRVIDLTNAIGAAGGRGGTIPAGGSGSSGNRYTRYIGRGLFAEWGKMYSYVGTGFPYGNYWTSDISPWGSQWMFAVSTDYGQADTVNKDTNGPGVCVYP